MKTCWGRNMPVSINSAEVYSFLSMELLDKDVDFVAFIVSPFHLLGVNAFMLEFYRKYNKRPKGIIFVHPHPKNGIIVNTEHLKSIEFADVRLMYIQKNENINNMNLLTFIKNGIHLIRGILNVIITRNNTLRKNLYVVSVMDIPISVLKVFENNKIVQKYSPIFVIIDEGIGSYMSANVWKLVRTYDRPHNKINLNEKLLHELTALLVSIIKKFVYHYVQSRNYLLFIKEADTLTPNVPAIISYKRALIHRYKQKSYPRRLFPSIKKPWAIIVTQPFWEYDQIEISDYISVLDKTIKVLTCNGFTVVLKPHPRESPIKYKILSGKYKNLIVFSQSTVILEDLLQLRPDIVLGFTTTALVTSKLFYDIQAVSMVDLLTRVSDDPLLNISSKEFKEKFQDIIWFANSIDELKRFLIQTQIRE